MFPLQQLIIKYIKYIINAKNVGIQIYVEALSGDVVNDVIPVYCQIY